MAPRTTEVCECAGKCDVVDVVTSRIGIGSFLPPAGHPTEYQLGIACETLIGPHSESFHYPGAKTLDDRVGTLHECEQCLDTLWMFEIECNVSTSSQHHIPMAACHVVAHGLCTIHSHDFGPHVGEHHRSEGTRTDARNLQDSNAAERTRHMVTSST